MPSGSAVNVHGGQGFGGMLSDCVNNCEGTRVRCWRSILRYTRRLGRRSVFSLSHGVGFLFTTAGFAHIFVANAILLGLFVGVKKVISITLLSAGAISLYSTARAFRDSPSGEELEGTAALGIPGLILPDTFLQLVDTYNRVLLAFPQLYRPKLAALQEGAPEELVLRFLAILSAHSRLGPHPGGPSALPTSHATEGNGGGGSGGGEGENGEEGELAAADGAGAGGLDAVTRAQREAYESSSPPEDGQMKDLQRWLVYAFAAYENMTSQERIEAWLSDRGFALVAAELASEAYRPAYFVAVAEEERLLVVCVRGTMDMNDAISDMIVTPESWGDADHQVHQGIGKSADFIYRRMRHTAQAFHETGHSIVLTGHSLGAGAAALVAWLLRTRDGLDRVRAVCYATPPCASPTISTECRGLVLSCVHRDDLVPRLQPRAAEVLEEELLGVTWPEMEAASAEWGVLGKKLFQFARSQAGKKKQKIEELTAHYAENPPHSDEADGDDAQSSSAGMTQVTIPGDVLVTCPSHRLTGEVHLICSDGAGGEDSPEEEGCGEALAFEQFMVPADSPCLLHLRLVPQALTDHYLPQYRRGLGMEPVDLRLQSEIEAAQREEEQKQQQQQQEEEEEEEEQNEG